MVGGWGFHGIWKDSNQHPGLSVAGMGRTVGVRRRKFEILAG